MYNKRKLDEVIRKAMHDPEEHCGYSGEEYCANLKYQEHVCGYVSKFWMPYLLAEYLYENCYYDDIETVKANLDYINLSIKKEQYYESWVDMTLEAILTEIEKIKEEQEKLYQDSEEEIDWDF